MAKAWAIARHGARCFGGRPVAYLAAALKQAWAEARDMAATVAAQRARVLAAVAALRFEASPLGVAIRRREEAAFEVTMQVHRLEMAARTAAYRARWGSGAVAVPRAA
jgi:hypothetical protein